MQLPRLTPLFFRSKHQRHQNFLRREIGFMLLLKVLLLCALWLLFFSHPTSTTEVATRIAERLAGDQQSPAVEAPSPTQNRE